MRYTVRYIKRSLLRNRVDIKTIDKEGVESITGSYNKNVLPGSTMRWRLKFDGQRGKFVLNMSEDRLNKMVEKISFFDDDGKAIKTANIRNPADPFFKHKDLICEFIGGDVVLDDENPLHEFFLECFKQDKNFHFDGDTSGMPKSALTRYLVTKAGGESKETSKTIDETLEAGALLKDMSFERQCQVLASFGVNIGSNPDPVIIKNTLYNKVIENKDLSFGGRRNIERFLELAKTNSSDLNLRTLVSNANSKGIIYKKPGNKYYFGEIFLGRNMDQVFDFVNNPDNSDIKNDIIKLVTR